MKSNFSSTKYIVTLAIFISFEIVLTMISNYINIGQVNINLALIPICVAAIMLGPLAGFIVGFINGILTLISPSTIAIFMPLSPFGTVLVCLFKTALAGLVCGLIFKLLMRIKNFNSIASMVIASLCVPIVNTGLFSLGAITFFRDFLLSGVSEQFPNIWLFLILGVIGWNFIIEVVTTIVVSPFVAKILNYYGVKSKDKKGENASIIDEKIEASDNIVEK